MLISKILAFLEGRVILYADKDNKDPFVTAMSRMGVSAKLWQKSDDDGVFAEMSPSSAKKVACALDKSGIIVYINTVCGIKSILIANIKRPGLFVGAFIFVALLMLSTLFVFRVEITGNDFVSAQQIKAELSDFGLRTGVRLDSIDRSGISDKFLLKHPEFSWAAISVKGTTVCVELKNKSSAQTSEPTKYDFLVADSDAVIKYLEVKSGKSLVSEGVLVKKGDLLVSGYISGNGLQYSDTPVLRYDGAVGEVYAQTEEVIEAFVPYEENTDELKSRERVGSRINIFGITFDFGTVDSNSGYDLSPERYITVFGVIELPVTVASCYYSESINTTVVRNEEQALGLARQQAHKMLVKALEKATLIRVFTEEYISESGVKVLLKYSCVRNIAVPMNTAK